MYSYTSEYIQTKDSIILLIYNYEHKQRISLIYETMNSMIMI